MSSVLGVTANSQTYSDFNTAKPAAESSSPVKSETKDTAASEGAVYDKTSAVNSPKATYKVNKMSAEDREALVKQLKSEQASRQNQMLKIVNEMLSKQANTYAKADDNFWKIFTQETIKIDPDTDYAKIKADAQADIAEDGYFGVKQTSQRLFDFASALAGDDVDKMKEMQKAVEKGFKQAEKLWGGEKKLPKISYDTLDAVNKLFDDYYKSKETISEETV